MTQIVSHSSACGSARLNTPSVIRPSDTHRIADPPGICVRGFHKHSDLRASRMRVKDGMPPFADDMMITEVLLFNLYKAHTHPQAYRNKMWPVCFLSIMK